MIAIAHPRPLRPPGAHLLLAGQAIGALAAAVDVADQVVRPFGAAADAHSSRPRGGQDRGGPPRGRGPLRYSLERAQRYSTRRSRSLQIRVLESESPTGSEAALPMKVKTPAYARMRGCTARSIVQLIERGLPAKKKGGAWEVNVDQADRWVQQQRAADLEPDEPHRPGRESAVEGIVRPRTRSSPAARLEASAGGRAERRPRVGRRATATISTQSSRSSSSSSRATMVNLDARAVKQISTESPALGTDRRRDRVD